MNKFRFMQGETIIPSVDWSLYSKRKIIEFIQQCEIEFNSSHQGELLTSEDWPKINGELHCINSDYYTTSSLLSVYGFNLGVTPKISTIIRLHKSYFAMITDYSLINTEINSLIFEYERNLNFVYSSRGYKILYPIQNNHFSLQLNELDQIVRVPK